MKKILISLLFLLFCFLLCACGSAEPSPTPVPDAKEAGQDSFLGSADSIPTPEPTEEPYYHLSDDGRQLTVCLYSNPTTGYTWQWGTDKNDFIYLLFDDFISDADGPTVGAGGVYEAKFCPTMVSFGEVQLLLSYERVWEAEPISTHVLKLSIDPSGAITVISAT